MAKNDPKKPRDYEVGYGKPPVHSRFPKGHSGNPSGRPRGLTLGRAKQLAVKELYRTLRVKEGDKVLRLPAISAVLRSQIAQAIKGNGPAQRAVFEAFMTIERESAANDAIEQKAHEERSGMDDLEIARRIFFALERGKRELDRRDKESKDT